MSDAGGNAAAPRVYLLDIEGTVAPLSLTSEVLFPYARAHFKEFFKQTFADLEKHPEKFQESLGDDGVVRDMLMLLMENLAERDSGAPTMLPPGVACDARVVWMPQSLFIPQSLAYIYWLMDRDRKSTALKALQGRIWETGFESGQLKGMLFDDVPAAFNCWSQHARIAIYSSGSTRAQQFLFRHSTHGDLTPLIEGYFDTRTGPKGEADSYAAIARAMEAAPAEVLFISDAVRELDAARVAGCQTRLAVRPGNPLIADAHGHIAIESFAAL